MSGKLGTIVLDFDGVLHSYASGWQGEAVIPDPPVQGAVEFVDALRDAGYDVVVASTRANTPEGRKAMRAWLRSNRFDRLANLRIAEGKPAGRVYLDDRALRFTGVWPTVEEIEAAATPWNRIG